MGEEKKLDEIDFSAGEGYLVNGVLVDFDGNPVASKGKAKKLEPAPAPPPAPPAPPPADQ